MSVRNDKKALPKREGSRSAILDAAEQIFADRGYVGASIRDICRQADVNSGLVSYYFKNKDALFEQVIERRCAEFLAMFARHMGAIDMSRPGKACARAIIGNYAGFLLRLSIDDTWRFYVRLLGKAAGAYDEELVGRLLTRFEPIPELTLSLLCEALPEHDFLEIKKGLFYLEAALSTMIAGDQLLNRRLALGPGDDHEQVIQDIADFFGGKL